MFATIRLLLRDPRLVASFVVGLNILFSLVATFTFITFHLSAPPFSLDMRSLSLLFSVYLVGAISTPYAGRFIDSMGFKQTLILAMAVSVSGVLLTLVPNLYVILAGLTISCSSLFLCQSATHKHRCASSPVCIRQLRPVCMSVFTTLVVFLVDFFPVSPGMPAVGQHAWLSS